MPIQGERGRVLVRAGLAIGSVIVAPAVLLTVVVHDLRCNTSSFALCQRADETQSRDPSGGCFVEEDPLCHDGTPCTDSRMLKESTRSCSWVF